MMKVDVLIPTLKRPGYRRSIESLRHLPFPHKLHLITEGKSWPEAVNIGLAKTKQDVLIMDDDVELLPDTFKDFDKFYPHADEFGFKLMFPNGRLQHGGGVVINGRISHLGHGSVDDGRCDQPLYCPHVTTSLCYIKRCVLDKVGGMVEDYPGYQFEDVDWSLRVIQAGFKILYIPNPAIHSETQTKRAIKDFDEGFQKNYTELRRRFLDDVSFLAFLKKEFPNGTKTFEYL